MKKQYDFSKGKKNPYIANLKKQVTIRLDAETIDYFKHLSENNGIPYQIIACFCQIFYNNSYMRDCGKFNSVALIIKKVS